MSKYVCKRKDVWSGILYKNKNVPFGIFYRDGTEMRADEFIKKGFSPNYSAKIRCRQMLIKVNEEKMAEDLIYNTPTLYPIDGFASVNDSNSDFVIEEIINLEELLKYMEYNESLTQEDLGKIYKKLIVRKKWLEKNCNLFGYEKGRYNYYRMSEETPEIPSDIFERIETKKTYGNGKPSKYEPDYKLIKKK